MSALGRANRGLCAHHRELRRLRKALALVSAALGDAFAAGARVSWLGFPSLLPSFGQIHSFFPPLGQMYRCRWAGFAGATATRCAHCSMASAHPRAARSMQRTMHSAPQQHHRIHTQQKRGGSPTVFTYKLPPCSPQLLKLAQVSFGRQDPKPNARRANLCGPSERRNLQMQFRHPRHLRKMEVSLLRVPPPVPPPPQRGGACK